MTSRVYAAGVRATAITNMVTDLRTMYTVQSDGTFALNTAALKTYLDAQLLLVPSDKVLPVGTTTDMVVAALRSISTFDFVTSLDAALRKERFMTRSDWPRSYGTVTGDYLVGAIKTAIAEGLTLSDIVTQHYQQFADATSASLKTLVQNYYDEANLDSVVPPGVTRIVNTRTYVYVYQTDKGELSAPSDPSPLVSVDQNDSVTVTAAAPPSGRFVDTVLWYRSQSSASDDAFQFVDKKTVASGLTYSDTKIAEELEEPCPSFDWLEPNTVFRQMLVHPNGFGVGWFDNTVAFSVANRMYAWPSATRKTTRVPIVGVGLFGTTVFVGTKGEPYLMTGTDPYFMSSERVNGGQACRSAKSIVTTAKGIVYAGADGICLCNGMSETPIISANHFTKKQWEALNPESIFAVEHDQCYYFWTNGAAGPKCYSLGLDTGKLVEVEITASAVFLNPDNGKMYAMSNTGISEVFGGSSRRTAVWRSPRISGSAVNFSWKKIEGDFEQGALTIRWYRHFRNGTDDVVVHTVSSRAPARLPPGRPDEYEIEVEGKSAATTVAVTTDVQEMKGV